MSKKRLIQQTCFLSATGVCTVLNYYTFKDSTVYCLGALAAITSMLPLVKGLRKGELKDESKGTN